MVYYIHFRYNPTRLSFKVELHCANHKFYFCPKCFPIHRTFCYLHTHFRSRLMALPIQTIVRSRDRPAVRYWMFVCCWFLTASPEFLKMSNFIRNKLCMITTSLSIERSICCYMLYIYMYNNECIVQIFPSLC